MKCYIGCDVGRELGSYYDTLINTISDKFDLEKLRTKERKPRITIKSPFEIESIGDLSNTLEDFCSHARTSYFSTCGFGSFDDNLIYMGIKPSGVAIRNIGKLLDLLKTSESIHLEEYDSPDKVFHVTLAKGKEMGGKFTRLQDYVLHGLNPIFDIPFDNVTLYGKKRGRSEVIRRFEMG